MGAVYLTACSSAWHRDHCVRDPSPTGEREVLLAKRKHFITLDRGPVDCLPLLGAGGTSHHRPHGLWKRAVCHTEVVLTMKLI